MNRRIDPLSQEERELAERLGRLGGPREPAPALDAAILAAARAAVAEDAAPPTTLATAPLPAAEAKPEPKLDPAATPAPTVTPFRPRRTVPRWPLGLSVAASLVLAAGIGWKLQGDGEGTSAEAAKSMSASAPAAAEDAMILDPSLDRAPVQAPPPPPPLEDDVARRVAEEAPAPQQALAKTARKDAEAAGGNAQSADAFQAPAAFPAAPAAAPVAAAPPAERDADISVSREAKGYLEIPGAQVPRTAVGDGRDADVGAAEYTRTPLEQRREQAKSVNRAADAAAAPPPPPPAPSMTVPERARQAGQGLAGNAAVADKPTGAAAESAERYDDRPPVSADSPAFRQAWLQRIRTLLAKGDTAAAGASLQEFRRRYPGVELPDDLRKFAATLPPPAP